MHQLQDLLYWIPRPLEVGELTRAKIEGLGVHALCAPVITIKPLSFTSHSLHKGDVYVITSARALFALEKCDLSHDAYIVGKANYESAQHIYNKLSSSNAPGGLLTAVRPMGKVIYAGDSIDEALMRLEQAPGRIYYIRGEHISVDVASCFLPGKVIESVVYTAAPLDVPSVALKDAFTCGRVGAVLLYSKRTALLVKEQMDCLKQQGVSDDFLHIRAYCLSSKIADLALMHGYRDIIVAEAPNEQSMLAKVQEFGFN